MRKIARYLYESGQLKRVRRSGWWVAGVDHPESVAEHSFRTALIACIVAGLEKADLEKVLVMALFHDMPETRINDGHRITRRYVDLTKGEEEASRDQARCLPEPLAALVRGLPARLKEPSTLEAKVVRDADLLECLFQAREYQERGYPVQEWIENAAAGLRTKTAREIAEACMQVSPCEWWKEES